ncbi:hypothetical protein AOLI_G00158900 [Acnodon oligacanthus]
MLQQECLGGSAALQQRSVRERERARGRARRETEQGKRNIYPWKEPRQPQQVQMVGVDLPRVIGRCCSSELSLDAYLKSKKE